MRFSKVAVAAVAATAVEAQRPSDVPICDYYTTALLKENNATNQATLLTLLVNTVVIGNYTQPNHNAVPGILAPGEVNGTKVNLLPYFNGQLASSNRDNKAVAINFLDDGGAAPLMKNMPANGTGSNQYFLLTHLYQFFGSLLGCSKQGMTGFSAYQGDSSMYQVHKFMDLSYAEVTYFVEQVGLAAKSFGVADADITAAAGAINGLFNVRCAPATTAIKAQGNQLQSICVTSDCPEAPKADCGAYTDKLAEPKNATSSATSTPVGTASSTSTAPASTKTAPATAGAITHGFSVAAALAGVAAFLL